MGGVCRAEEEVFVGVSLLVAAGALVLYLVARAFPGMNWDICQSEAEQGQISLCGGVSLRVLFI